MGRAAAGLKSKGYNMIHEFLQRHVAWRFGSTDYARRRFLVMATMRRHREASADGRCAHCHGTLDDPAFMTCTTCRRRRGNTQRAAQARRNAVGICARCPRRPEPVNDFETPTVSIY